MAEPTQKETLQFQAEVKQLLHLMIHSLYSNREIFLRELISNAADACDKLRFEALADSSLYEDDQDLHIEVDYDREARTVTVRDNGIGMTRGEVIENIGTIARSGTKEFLEALTGDAAKDAHLIGQFGVGFYSAFIVAERVTLTTRRAGRPAEEGVRWSSDGQGSFEIETVAVPRRGTEVVLHLREGESGFADHWRLRELIHKYSDYIPWPVRMRKLEGGKPTDQWEQVNKAEAIWAKPRSEVTEEEYKDFYKYIAHDVDDPLTWVHTRVEGKLEYAALLYVPAHAPFDLWDREHVHGVKLYVQRVFIADDTEHLVPRYLRFLRGVVDSADLPLNVSREMLQSNRIIDQIRAGITRRVLERLEELAEKEPETYQRFWDEFGRVLKEGPAEDFANRERIARLLRFASTHTDQPAQTVSLTDYVSRMKEGQKAIYYLTADSFTAAKNSPHLEVFREKGVEVLLLYDRVDEWLMAHLTEFDGRPLRSVAKGDVDLSALGEAATEEKAKAQDETYKPLLERIQKVLEGEVSEVRLSRRLRCSPSCIVLGEHEMALYMQHLLRRAGHEVPTSKPVLEINPEHPLVQRLKDEADEARFAQWARLLFEQAVLAEGGQLEDPGGFVARLNELMLAMAGEGEGRSAGDEAAEPREAS